MSFMSDPDVLERPPLDEVPYARYTGQEIGSQDRGGLRQEELPDDLDPDSEVLKAHEQEFLESGCQINPDMTVDASSFDTEKAHDDRHRLVALSGELSSMLLGIAHTDDAIFEAYSDRIDYDIAIIDMVMAAVHKN